MPLRNLQGSVSALRPIGLTLLLCFNLKCLSQENKRFFTYGPIKQGYFIPFDGNILRLGDQAGYVNIYSVHDSVTAISAGTVVHIFTVDGSYYLTIKDKKGPLYTTYGNFRSLAVQKDFIVDAGGFLGTIKDEGDSEYHLVVAIRTKRKSFTDSQVVDYLMRKVKRVRDVGK